MSKKPTISVVVNVKNEAENLNRCLKSIKNFADEIIVVDMHSSDDSVSIAQSYGAKVFQYRVMKFVEPARNYALSKATGKWIMLLDPDEMLPKSLKIELLKITQRTDIDYVRIPRKNMIFGKWIRHSNSWPDYLIRFFKKGMVIWKKEIHSQPETKGNGLTLMDSEKLSIKHYNYTSVVQFVYRAIRYSGIQADELRVADYKVKTSDFLLKPIQEFNSRFFAAEGYKDGIHGLVFSILQAFAIALVYIRLWEKQGAKEKTLAKESFVSASLETTFEYNFWFTKYFLQEYSKNIIKNTFIRLRLYIDRITKNF
jgi:(heptosyl)LPS beta-1,4-glucosyltransferase